MNQHHQQTKPDSSSPQHGSTATQHHRTRDTAQGNTAPQRTTAHSRAASHVARQEQPRQHTPVKNNSRPPNPATNSRQPQATTHSTSQRKRNNTASRQPDPAKNSWGHTTGTQNTTERQAQRTTDGAKEQHSATPTTGGSKTDSRAPYPAATRQHRAAEHRTQHGGAGRHNDPKHTAGRRATRPAKGAKSPVLGRPPRAPRSDPVKPGATAPGVGEGTEATGKPTRAPRATGPDEARRTNAGP